MGYKKRSLVVSVSEDLPEEKEREKKNSSPSSQSKRANIYSVAEEAGVSIATISRVLNNGQYVSSAAKERVWAAIKKLDYKPSQTAQGLAKKRSNLIGLMLPYCEKGGGSPLVHELLCGAVDAVMEAGRSLVLLTPAAESREKNRLNIRRITSLNLDSVIFVGFELTANQKRLLRESALPFVCLKTSELGHETGLRAAQTMIVSLAENDAAK